MPRVSKRKVNAAVSQRMKSLLLDVISGLNNNQEIEEFLAEFLTPTEKIMLAKRLAIAMLLVKEYQYESIREILKVSTSTIDRVSYWIKHEGRTFKKIVENIVKKEKDEENWHAFWQSISSATVTWTRGNWAARRKKIIEKEAEFRKKYAF